MKEILKIKTKNKCSITEAKRLYKEQNPIQPNLNQNSYSVIANPDSTKTLPSNINTSQSTQNNSTNPISMSNENNNSISNSLPPSEASTSKQQSFSSAINNATTPIKTQKKKYSN